MSKKKPTGFVAVCQCGKTVGAIDVEATPQKDAASLLGRWLMNGCTVSPRFTGTWSAQIEPCECGKDWRSGLLAGDVLGA